MNTKSLEYQLVFKMSPSELYELFMDEEKHSVLTESDVTMSTELTGEFSVFDGYCHGYNIELIPGRKIVQAWYFAEEGWPEDHFSECTFEFNHHSEGTLLLFKQTGIPEHKYEALKEGWNQFYWEPIRIFV